MKILYYDCFAGISGDMNLGALLDLGIDQTEFLKAMEKLSLEGYSIHIRPDSRKGISGTRVEVLLDNHSHSNHTHRHWSDIKENIQKSGLNENVKDISLKIFEIIAHAEAKIHGVPVADVAFHEVGAVDSIVDIVGAAVCLDILKPDKIMSSRIELGGGFVNSAHGKLPVPAPATAEILKDIPVKAGATPFEATTPTGAAILAATVDEYTDQLSLSIIRSGYGIGGRDTELPNVLRVYLAENTGTQKQETGHLMLECNIDDMNPELYESIIDGLLKQGADDVFITPIIMKKTRPAVKLSVLCAASLSEVLQETLIRNTSTFGIRSFPVGKTVLERDFKTVDTKYGKINIKTAYYQGKAVKYKPEYEDIRKAALKHGAAEQEVLAEAVAAARNQGGKS